MNESASRAYLKLIKHRHGRFDDYAIDGYWLEDCDDRAWVVKLVSERGTHSYKVSDNEFRSVPRVNIGLQTTITTGDIVQNLDPSIRHGVLDKISTWEKEENDALLADDLF